MKWILFLVIESWDGISTSKIPVESKEVCERVFKDLSNDLVSMKTTRNSHIAGYSCLKVAK